MFLNPRWDQYDPSNHKLCWLWFFHACCAFVYFVLCLYPLLYIPKPGTVDKDYRFIYSLLCLFNIGFHPYSSEVGVRGVCVYENYHYPICYTQSPASKILKVWRWCGVEWIYCVSISICKSVISIFQMFAMTTLVSIYRGCLFISRNHHR